MSARLIYIVGASGSGKDSLMRHARERLAQEPSVVFAHRYITRPAQAGGENHIALTPSEFDARHAAGLFAMRWNSHGLNYGIGIEIHQWLAKNVSVIVNGSREYLDTARTRYRDLLPVWIDVAPEVLRERLLARGRESLTEIEARLIRHTALQCVTRVGEIIHNNGPIEESGAQLVKLIERHVGARACV
jgi:ribose 1,5-bisphosphokinase